MNWQTLTEEYFVRWEHTQNTNRVTNGIAKVAVVRAAVDESRKIFQMERRFMIDCMRKLNDNHLGCCRGSGCIVRSRSSAEVAFWRGKAVRFLWACRQNHLNFIFSTLDAFESRNLCSLMWFFWRANALKWIPFHVLHVSIVSIDAMPHTVDNRMTSHRNIRHTERTTKNAWKKADTREDHALTDIQPQLEFFNGCGRFWQIFMSKSVMLSLLWP